jgi:hypothetical protein
MNSANNINKITKFLAKQVRPKNFKCNHPAELESKSFYLKPKESDLEENVENRVEDIGYMQRKLNAPKSTSTFKNKTGFHEGKSILKLQ